MLMKTSKSTLPFFKQHFGENVNFGQNSSNFGRFCESNFGRMYFFFFLPFFFALNVGYEVKARYFLAPQKFWVKRVKKGYHTHFGQKVLKITKFQFPPKIPLFRTLFTPFVLFSHKYDRFINPGYFMLKRVSECTIPFF